VVALWNPTGLNDGVVTALGQLGMRLLRYPGGVPAQWTGWTRRYSKKDEVLSHEDAYELARRTRTRLVLQTNVATDKPEDALDSSGAHHARWAEHLRERGVPVAAWEIGNEPEIDAPESIRSDLDKVYEWYNAKYAEHVTAIRSVDPEALVMGPASANTWFWWAKGALAMFLRAHGNKGGSGLAELLSVHWYPDAHKGSWPEKRGTAQDWEACMDYLKGVIAEHDTRDLPLHITEWNWGAGMDTAASQHVASALGNADVVGMFMRTGVQGHQFFTLQRIRNNWGVLAVKGEGMRENEPSPSYFALSLASKLENEVLAVSSQADERNVLSAYAARRKGGDVVVLLINKSEAPLVVDLAFARYAMLGKRVEVHELRGKNGQLEDTEVVFNGVTSPRPDEEPLPSPRVGQAQGEFQQRLEPYSLSLVSFAP
jgi:hypothetical protein